MTELLTFITDRLAENKDGVKISSSRNDDGTEVLTLTADKEDMGRIIGRGGRTARDIRVILRAAAGIRGERVTLEIADSE